MPLTRDQFLAPSKDGVWYSQIRSLEELSQLEVAQRASLIVPGVAEKWKDLCIPFLNCEPDYDTMEEENTDEWVYMVRGLMDPMYDALPLELPSTIVYRLQTPDGDGVFSHGVGLRSLIAPEDGCPQNDPAIKRFVQSLGFALPQIYQKSWFFGCQTLEGMHTWLAHGNISDLHAHNIEIGVYEVNSQWCIHGHNQSVFRKEFARLSQRIALSEIFNISEQNKPHPNRLSCA